MNSGNHHLVHTYANYTTISTGADEENTQTIPAVCGAVLTRYQDEYCNVSIADPGWDKDWCEPCVVGIAWSNEATAGWRKRGLDAKELTEYILWLKTPEGEYPRPSFRKYIEMTQAS